MRTPTVREGTSSGAGDRQIGGYHLVGHLGTGSCGSVYLGRRAGIQRLFAVKVLNPSIDAEGAARFQREAQIAARLDHKGIVPVIDCGQERGHHYLVMEHVPGKTLQELLRERSQLPWKEAAELVAAVADAVGVAHANGVIHRDLKPANILIDGRDQTPRVTDFGLARDASRPSDLTRDGDTIGYALLHGSRASPG